MSKPPGIPVDSDLQSYAFDLPEERIAAHPAARRESSRLMVVERGKGVREICAFADLARLLPPGALLVANNTKVVPARVTGTKPSGGKIEMLLLTPPVLLESARGPGHDATKAPAEALIRASKPPRPGDRYIFASDLAVNVVSPLGFGRCQVEIDWRGSLTGILARIGSVPLPPYIKRAPDASDLSRYQTVYARDDKAGSAAAPTAGLHFSPELRREIAQAGFGWAELTLHVGYGTFSPVRSRDIRDHAMHREFVEIPPDTAAAVALAKADGRPVVAVGTTSVRALEGACLALGRVAPYQGYTDIFITPGFAFQVVDHCITNFHLPKSTLLIMVCALAGKETILRCYDQAVRSDFRFFSYGDAMLII